jgi:hypothetical protein
MTIEVFGKVTDCQKLLKDFSVCQIRRHSKDHQRTGIGSEEYAKVTKTGPCMRV